MSGRVDIVAAGLLAPGLDGWESARATLAGDAPFALCDVAPRPSVRLAAAERRRLNPNACWALAVASEALDAAPGLSRASIASVFASADGDGEVLAQTLAALASPPVSMSPTLFHNSVFNAPAGYCSIAHQLTGPSTSLCAGEFTFGVALADALDQVGVDGVPVLFVAVDVAYPQALAGVHRSVPSFACALLLCASADRPPAQPSLGSLALVAESGPRTADAAAPAWTRHWSNATVAAALPLLVAIARGAPARIALQVPARSPLAVDFRR